MSNTQRTDAELEAAFNFMKSFSWRDKNGELRMHKAWATLANLQVPFPEIYDDPEGESGDHEMDVSAARQ